jgi:diguanylate cyclase (GGDEF)-like protein
VPAVLCLVCVVRFAWWLRTRHHDVDAATAARRLRRTVRLAAILALFFTAWGLSLYPYGDEYQQSHVAFYMAITVIGCIFCLMHLRAAALSLTVIVIIPFVIFFSLTGKLVFVSIAVNLFLVSVAMVVILLTYYRDFARLIESREELNLRQIETQRLSDDNFRLANLDSVTGLPNRRAFFAYLDGISPSMFQDGRGAVIGLVDLDGFKLVNDAYGHAIGDRVLAEVGRRLQQFEDSSAFLARLGGDEFGVLLRGDLSNDDVTHRGTEICRVLRLPYHLPDMTARLSASIGFAVSRGGVEGVDVLFERADYALYNAKQNSRGKPVIFSTDHEIERRRSGLIEQALAQADLERELSLDFQPIIELPGKHIAGFEALARWTNSTLGTVPPAEFIRRAERSNRILLISEILLERALECAKGWPDHVRVSFNLSTRDIASPEATRRIVEIISASRVPAHRIELEITETALVSDFAVASDSLRLLKQLGVHISLDDFGTGFSSLSYVHRLPLDKIKIDRSFVADIATNTTSQKVVKSVVDLCRNLNLDCIVEGVETEDQVRILGDLGCRKMQGYLFGRPMSADEVISLLTEESATPRFCPS